MECWRHNRVRQTPPRTDADTAFLEGVKAGLEAAAQWADRGKATYVKWVGQCAGHDERYMAADAIRGIDPASVTRQGGADE